MYIGESNMNKYKIVGIVLMAPLILLIIGVLVFLIYTIITDAPFVIFGGVIVLLFDCGRKLFNKR